MKDIVVPSDDGDIFDGRFKPRKKSDASQSLAARSTVAPCEELLKEFFEPDFKTYFSYRADESLFMKILSADGLDTSFKNCLRIHKVSQFRF